MSTQLQLTNISISYHYRSVLPMPQLTPDYDRVMVFRLLTPNTTHFDLINIFKMIQMVMEVRISEDYCRSDIQIYDFSAISVGHVSKFTLPLLKKYEMCAIVSVTRNVPINTFTAIVDLTRFNNSCLKSPASTLVDLTFQSRALHSFSLNQLRNLSL